ncbi:MAG TPA: hypothetical protein VFT85_05005, partial [Acidimicrobiia bacterium]|nr:hypothetical protein [Acidimicrobiia bacterium]
MTQEAPPSVEEPQPQRPAWLERIAPSEIDWKTVVVIPLLAVLSALIIGAVIIVLTDGFDAV